VQVTDGEVLYAHEQLKCYGHCVLSGCQRDNENIVLHKLASYKIMKQLRRRVASKNPGYIDQQNTSGGTSFRVCVAHRDASM
jgi:hypothetical protein